MSIETIKERYKLIEPFLNEKQKRLFAATEASVIGRGGISIVSREIGICRQAIAT